MVQAKFHRKEGGRCSPKNLEEASLAGVMVDGVRE